MKQKTLITIILLTLAATIFQGCTNEAAIPQAVVVNMGTIKEATGYKEQIKNRLDAMNKRITEEMDALSAKLAGEIEAANSSLGESPSAEDRKKIKILQEQMREQFVQARNDLYKKREQETAEIRQSYLDEILPIARKIALDHGASIILKSRGVFWTDGTVDITEEIIARMPGATASQPEDTQQSEERPGA